jgi:glycosyltransferase involved in cell wall biosynthesis
MERVAGIAANVVVVDNQAIGRRYLEDYGTRTVFVPYGANVVRNDGTEALSPWGLQPQKYVLWVGRLEPETRVEELIEAFSRARLPDFKLAIVGDAPFADEYKKRLRSLATTEVTFTGRQFGNDYQQLSCNAFAYVQTSPTSGTSPALLDQMAFGNAVIVRGTETNSEVVSDAGLTYRPDDPIDGLAKAIRSLYDDPSSAAKLRLAAIDRVRTNYSWEHIIDVYEELFVSLVTGGRVDKRN